jgi:thiol-disulfide isomerase/thioredoxin
MKFIYVLLAVSCLYACKGKPIPPFKTGLEGTPLPAFNLLLLDSVTRFNTSSIPAGEPIVLFYFTPECPFCRAQTEEIVKNMPAFSRTRFYLITLYPFKDVKDYYKHYGLEKYSNVTLGLDYNAFFGGYFKADHVPYMAVYNKDKQLKQVFPGKVSVKAIKDVVLE